MNFEVCALPTWVIICEFPSPFARIRKLPWWSPSSLPVEVAKEWDAHAEGWISGESTWRQFFRCRKGLLRQPGETSDDGLVVRSCIILQLQYNVLWIPWRPSWLLFELSCQMCTFIPLDLLVHHMVLIAPFPQVFFSKPQDHKLSISQSPNKNSESFPRWRCASCDLLFVLLEILGWKIQPCYIITGGNLPTPGFWTIKSAIEDGSFCHGVQCLGGRSDTFQGIWPRRSVKMGWLLMGTTMSRYLEEKSH